MIQPHFTLPFVDLFILLRTNLHFSPRTRWRFLSPSPQAIESHYPYDISALLHTANGFRSNPWLQKPLYNAWPLASTLVVMSRAYFSPTSFRSVFLAGFANFSSLNFDSSAFFIPDYLPWTLHKLVNFWALWPLLDICCCRPTEVCARVAQCCFILMLSNLLSTVYVNLLVPTCNLN